MDCYGPEWTHIMQHKVPGEGQKSDQHTFFFLDRYICIAADSGCVGPRGARTVAAGRDTAELDLEIQICKPPLYHWTLRP